MAGNQLALAKLPSQEQPESAPSSADFYFEDLNFKPTDSGLELMDFAYTTEWLPPLKELREDIRYLVSGRERGIPRLDMVIEYVDWLRSRVEPDSYDGNKAYARCQAGPRVFLDSLSLVARHRKYQVDKARFGGRAPETFQDLIHMLELKREMKLDIDSYVRLNQNTPSNIMFNNLLTMMGLARRVAFNDEVGSVQSMSNNKRELIGLLAENKVVRALQYNRWPLADHASATLDSIGVDAIVPVDISPKAAVALQVKSSVAPGGMFEISSHGNRNLVVVPMHMQTNDPFTLGHNDTLQLNSYIYRASRMSLPRAA